MRSKTNMANETETLAAAALPDNQVTEISGPHSSKHSRKKASNSAKDAGRSSSVAMQSGPSPACMKAESQTKLPKPKINLRALFDYHFTRKQHRFRKRWNPTETKPRTSRRYVRKWSARHRIPEEEQRRRMKERGIVFPFVEKYYGRKHLPLKTVREYEHAALKGFFKYIEMLKYEDHLKKSLTRLNAGGDLENECLESRRHKYMDDDGPISPIAETSNEDSGNEDIGAKIVDNSCFILSSKIPKKKKKLNSRRK
ncbi:TATA box-binding protein-associated factor RNA polymerase I subunit D isoform X1 [Pantherophis guttatus]|uniref:TATA box-binding protein-associated factor RNA polymerase I subunit D n=2 Tax=Pantherophis guttatus TaxID=94885 RepID=A0ABM3Z1E5_PANGU|nr:TATA box-binding protein-associated factor RNA polymerase I subunit D isoform X1 [Pantherophis guttatus]XP_060542191.1 TATA box-binding protein-associated factor RNA polymerase I subunit D isoform X1 [Pantherophis guttatus]XP_060542192.1 TATA box-binding protein-associated factor RNA polymerase I subunit D isoform X1 [Pantherophis guttatus]XP_060542193.1 TATA box-binding protein-associated factor RNA polymerase I subunit D isoform X1 [Pantherophis guttatus]